MRDVVKLEILLTNFVYPLLPVLTLALKCWIMARGATESSRRCTERVVSSATTSAVAA